MQGTLRSSGYLETGAIIAAGIACGRALEVGSGPGHLGLDWLARTRDSSLVGLDLSPEMAAIARGHADEEGLAARAAYVVGPAEAMPFEAGSFDAVFSANSLHEWLDPAAVLAQIRRVLRPGGRLFLSDLRRDLPEASRVFLERRMPPGAVREGLLASLAAAYTVDEAKGLMDRAGYARAAVEQLPLGLRVIAETLP